MGIGHVRQSLPELLDVKVKSSFYNQIEMDVLRTHSTNHWFDVHRPSICRLLNIFACTNIGFGYPQGLNFLVFPLWKVYFLSDPDHVMYDTFVSLQRLVGELLTVYPIHKNDTDALNQMERICMLVRLGSVEKYKDLSTYLFCGEYEPFLISIVTTMVPTLFSNVFNMEDCLLLWDNMFALQQPLLVQTIGYLVRLIIANRNAIMHMPIHTCMSIVRHSVPFMVHLLLEYGN